jgi:hypothetical protein
VAAVALCMFAVHLPDKPNQGSPASETSSYEQASIATNNKIAQAEKNGSRDETPKWYASPEGAEWALVGVGLITFIAIAYQACEMRKATDAMRESTGAVNRQADVMENQFAIMQPRLHVEGVRAGFFKEGQQPFFFVKIMNSGVVAAESVAISIKVEIGNSNTVQYPRDPVILIPGNSSRELPIRSSILLDKARLAEFDSGKVSLRISGHVIWNQKTIEYCYKYWPLDPRPKNLRRFVPCDFYTGITIGLAITANANLIMAPTASVAVETEKPTPEPLKKRDDPI